MSNRVAIIGTGSIGMDLMCKTISSKGLDLRFVVGRRSDSPGMKEAMLRGVATSSEGISYLEDNIEEFDIVFDATSANSHVEHDRVFSKHNKFVVDLTPAKIGELCVPVINMESLKDSRNINLITCGGQASLPLAYALKNSCEKVMYVEVISSISSDSAGIATRENLNEYVETTEFALKKFTDAEASKAILNINPAVPQVCMQTTLYARCEKVDIERLENNVNNVVKKVKEYVPGYNLVLEPLVDSGSVTLAVQVYGSGDYLPEYSGNLDIINSAAIAVAKFKSKVSAFGSRAVTIEEGLV
ncbi:acetaldehyde dehydrogenase (acetylating) [Halomonas salipaludis]|uniref:Acetaldehyde dehydrogenase n=1 Tax=Halomonas salipaludis TaxID=2032625 RepID=A0A2A2ESG9_9GAMM|nr:acetaldehyde dehydrogenase (acetylating) [Halomonas salipaludis]PAU76076.1 acetaldehyde dehydrogenase (acetylating) [Halomonas salipaludis]